MNEDYLLTIIGSIEQQKANKGVFPYMANREEIMTQIHQDMRQCLKRLFEAEKIIYHRTLNSWAVEINNK